MYIKYTYISTYILESWNVTSIIMYSKSLHTFGCLKPKICFPIITKWLKAVSFPGKAYWIHNTLLLYYCNLQW